MVKKLIITGEEELGEDIIQSYIQKVNSTAGLTLNFVNDERCEVKKGRRTIGVMETKEESFEIEGEEVIRIIKTLKDKRDKLIKSKLTEKDVTKTPFKNMFSIKPILGGLDRNRKVFNLLNKSLTELGIKEIISKSIDGGDTIKNNLTLCIDCGISTDTKSFPSGHIGRLRTILFNNYKTNVDNAGEINIKVRHKPAYLEKEVVEEIKLKNFVVGDYYKERNLVFLYFNPFTLAGIGLFEEKIQEVFKELFQTLKDLKIKEVDTGPLQKKLFITGFLKGARGKIDDLKHDLKIHEGSIKDYQISLTDCLRKRISIGEQIKYLDMSINGDSSVLFDELNEAEKLPFVKKVELAGSNLNITFIPTTITVNKFERNSHGKNHGKRTFYIGSITFKISPSKFRVMNNELTIGSRAHPHCASQNANPCFGDGDGNKAIFELLAANKFCGLAKMLFFWIKTYRDSGAYIHLAQTYDSLLQQGIPVWDENNKRIEINDPKRIKTGEQIERETKPNYKTNREKYKDVKV